MKSLQMAHIVTILPSRQKHEFIDSLYSDFLRKR